MKLKNIVIIILTMILFLTISTNTYADHSGGGGGFGSSAVTINPDDFKPTTPTEADAGTSIDLAKKIIGGITAVGTVVAVAVIIGLGIKYMMASVEQKAEYKKTMLPIFIGAILLFGCSWIISIVYNIMQGIS